MAAQSSRLVSSAIIVVGLLAAGLTALAQQAGDVVSIDTPVDRDQYLAGEQVTVAARVDGDVVAAGALVKINAAVAGDVIAAGESVTVSAPVGDDVRIAGQNLSLDANVDGHVVAAGNSVVLARGAEIGDWFWVAGNTVTVAGRVGDELRVGGNKVVISGEVNGDADIAAQTIEIKSGARIRGDLNWRSPNAPDISAEAMIDGQILERAGLDPEEGGLGGWLFVLLALLVALVALLWLFPGATAAIARRVRAEPLKALGAGLAVLLLMPLAAVFMLFTGVGAVLGMVALLAYLILLLSGFLVACAAVGLVGLSAMGRSEAGVGTQILSAVVATIVIMLVGLIPVLGGIALLILWLLGLGGLVLALADLYTGGSRKAAD